MASSKTVRRLAFAAMFQLDARNGADVNSVREGLAEDEPRKEDLEEAMKVALAAWSDRNAADRAMTRLAPAWPAHRQALADRAILRLGHYELTKGHSSDGDNPPKVVINDMVALAKEYSTEKSPAFVNALLDKILKESEAKDAAAQDSAKKAAAAQKAAETAKAAPIIAPIEIAPIDPDPVPPVEPTEPDEDEDEDEDADAGVDQSVTEGEG